MSSSLNVQAGQRWQHQDGGRLAVTTVVHNNVIGEFDGDPIPAGARDVTDRTRGHRRCKTVVLNRETWSDWARGARRTE